MWCAWSCRTVRSVKGERVDIRLELRLDGESLSGRVRDDAGATREFTGRLGLLAAIDALVAPMGSSDEHPERGET
jgi:hypothetical protein